MKTIIITGPSGSGKTYLANKLYNYFNFSLVLQTDSYYRDDLFIKLMSIFAHDIYDRVISLKKKELIKTIESIYNNNSKIILYNYDFRIKKSSKLIRNIDSYKDIKFLFLEGVFAHRLDINYKKTINILCNEKKDSCYQRRLKRDELERGRNRKEVKNKFSRSWNLFYENLENYISNNKVITLNTNDQSSYKQLIDSLKLIS
tara:strand:+ start:320 stop:925 length:606 start_codon:yes stop_codon:yes gene_type:complete